jgi:hypothetical protein
MAAITSRNQQGKREDLSDVIAVVDAKDTPFTSMLTKGKEPANDEFSWQADAYPKPRIRGSVDSKDITEFENFSRRQRLWGRIQMIDRSPMVSTIADTVENPAGIGKRQEFAKSVTKAITMVKRDMEVTACSNCESQPDDGTNAFMTRGAFKWTQTSAQADLPVPTAFRTPASSIYAGSFAGITEAAIRDGILGSVWNQSGKTADLKGIVGKQLKSLISAWTVYYPDQSGSTIVRKFQEWDEARVLAAVVDTIVGDFGTIELFPTPWLRWDLLIPAGAEDSSPSTDPGEAPTIQDVRERNGLFLDLNMWEIRYNQKPYFQRLEDKGGGPRGYVRAIFALVCLNPLGQAKIQPLNM